MIIDNNGVNNLSHINTVSEFGFIAKKNGAAGL